ncbi:hypothetical protein MMC28_001035 [Mycoblastus sanguinarius]|nr:hypothetical protein [Mycoblastus sanguinarius]
MTLLTVNFSYKLEKAIIVNDLTKELPQWILSAYGPGREAPLQLFGGSPREQSFEELRVRHYELASQGNQQQAVLEAQALVKNAQQQIQTALSDVDGGIKYILNGENQHPNRRDICKGKGAQPTQAQNPVVNPQPNSTFGQPATSTPTFGPSSSPLAFGRPPAPTFGRTSAPVPTFGQPSTSAFGQPAFGQPATLGHPRTSFGQPASSFGNPSAPTPAFGQPTLGAPQKNQSPFGAPSGPSGNQQAVSQPTNPFSRQAAPTQPSSFGQQSGPSQQGVFGKPPAPNNSNAFSQPTTSGPAMGSGQTALAPLNPFGQPIAPSGTSAFNQPSKAAPSSFGQPRTNQASTSNQSMPAFGQPFATPDAAPPPSALVINGTSIRPVSGQSAANVQVQKDSQGRIRTWEGKAVSYIDSEPCYKGSDGSWQKIWFPDGPPVFKKTIELPDEAYDDTTKESYRFLKQNGTFKDGIMPDLPPKREWCSWNF